MRIGNRKPEITYVFAGHWNSSECVKLTLLIHFEIFCNLFPKRHLLWGKFFNSSCWSFILRRNVLDKIWLINMVRMKLSSILRNQLAGKEDSGLKRNDKRKSRRCRRNNETYVSVSEWYSQLILTSFVISSWRRSCLESKVAFEKSVCWQRGFWLEEKRQTEIT